MFSHHHKHEEAAATASHQQMNLPTRTNTQSTEEDAIPAEDTSEVTRLFSERLSAWKHACGYLEDYVTATEKMQHAHGKEYEKVLKTVSSPIKEGHHFDQSLGGVAGMFDNIRSNTQGISNSHYDAAKALKGSVMPIFDRLHDEVKHKDKEISKSVGKGGKAVDKARNATQKQIEHLGQHTATFDSTGGKVEATNDPYVLKRAVLHRLHKQVQEENNNRQDLLAVQDNFARFEAHIVQTIQQGMGQFQQILTMQAENVKHMYGDMASTAQRIPPDFEWKGFVKRNNELLIDPSVPQRDINNIAFPNQDHRATQALIEGALEKKGKLLRKYDTAYYAVTPSHFMHEYKTDDLYSKDPTTEMSLYLPDCTIGALEGTEFSIKGKDVSKGKVGSLMSITHEFEFRAHTPQDAAQWYEVITKVAGQHTAGSISDSKTDYSSPTTPTTMRSAYADEKSAAAFSQPGHVQTQGLAGAGGAGTVPYSAGAVPHSAGVVPHSAGAVPHSAGYGNLGPAPGYTEQGISGRDMATGHGVPGNGLDRASGQY